MDGDREEGQQAPTIDTDRLAGLIDERFRANLTTFYQEQQAQQHAQEQQRQHQERVSADTFGQLVDPYLRPAVNALQFQSNDTRDYADFYMNHPEARERKAEIEQKFREMASQNRAIPRDDINTWITGREAIRKDRDEATQAALRASTLQAGSAQRGALIDKDPREMSREELAAFLADVSI